MKPTLPRKCPYGFTRAPVSAFHGFTRGTLVVYQGYSAVGSNVVGAARVCRPIALFSSRVRIGPRRALICI